ncbi:hypothetical protein Mgra_00009146 [Meloidogyne graminicola]|uniref:RRM domain-containing protein n=1 Tax=Meloidogyne graminicola TaxID=189291 RepID=A0A8S9ZDT3_9BILA|nr:hypothetical protein Mgra_00009146 [Meloidogyne graminicola]
MDLKDLMRNAGEVTYADAHKKVRNEAVICFASHEDLRRALDRYQGKDINGRRIKLVDDSDGYGGGSRRSRTRSRSRSAYRSRSRSPPSRTPSPAENGRSRSRTRSRSRSLSSASRKSGSPSLGRIIQLDAKILDNALISAFCVALRDVDFYLYFSNRISDLLETHRDTLLSLFYHLMHAFTGQSPGQRLMNIRYGNFTKLKGILNYIFCILLPTISSSLVNFLPSNLRNRRSLIKRVISTFKLFEFCYFLYFLKFGGSAHPMEAILGIKPVYDKSPKIGQINYGALNRELFGHSFAYFLILFIPLWTRIFTFLKRTFLRKEEKVLISMTTDRLVCSKCNKLPICAIRARKIGLTDWMIFCFFCYTSHRKINKDWEMEQITDWRYP